MDPIPEIGDKGELAGTGRQVAVGARGRRPQPIEAWWVDACGEELAMGDAWDLQRFLDAQEPVYPGVLQELRSGQKRSHWMWFIFPQIQGLGWSPISRKFAIASQDEARAYAEHPVLGGRLRECTQLVLDIPNRDVRRIFGSPDDLKFRSSMTLFSASLPEEPLFQTALDAFFGGQPDRRTLELLGR